MSIFLRFVRFSVSVPSQQLVSSYVTKNTTMRPRTLHNNTIDFTQMNDTIVHALTWFFEHRPILHLKRHHVADELSILITCLLKNVLTL